MMERFNIYYKEINAHAEVSRFAPKRKTEEFHVMIHVAPCDEMFPQQYQRICQAEDLLLQHPDIQGAKVIFKRYFVSDATNQKPLMRQENTDAVSLIQQPPLDGSKVAVWIYLAKELEVTAKEGCMTASHNGYTHIYKMGMHEHNGDSATQTESLLLDYEETLAKFNATLADNCIRTWFFVRDVDTQYAGMVKARRENFTEQGLTEKTHYIASTGIGGLPADTRSLVQLGTYALTGHEPTQVRYLYAPAYLNPTYEYGVTFERGTCIDYGDRSHVMISGTASINNKGEVMYIGDINKQLDRMCENVETLLSEGGASFADVMQIVVYLRDLADYKNVKERFDSRFPDIPCLITLAPVCRPTWLIEMECIAIVEKKNSKYRNF